MTLFKNLIDKPTRETRRELKDVLLARDHNMLAALIQDFGAIQIIAWIMNEHNELAKKLAEQQADTHRLKIENRKLHFRNNQLANTTSKASFNEHISFLQNALYVNTKHSMELEHQNKKLKAHAQELTERTQQLGAELRELRKAQKTRNRKIKK